jgi:hypothetical protein
MNRLFRTGSILLALLAAGCLQKDTTHTLYLSPDGSLRWTVEEFNVHSDEADAGSRLAEEQAYIGPALIGGHRAAAGLQAIGPLGVVNTTIIRDERPFHVVTDARFLRIDYAFVQLLKQSGAKGSAALEGSDDRHTLRIRFDFSQEIDETDRPAAALLDDFGKFRFVLAEGHFVAGGGFDVPDRTRAVVSREWMAAMEDALAAKRTIELALTWTEQP